MGTSYLHNISPIDGRYRNQLDEIRKIFSEYSFYKNRVLVEVKWFKKLLKISGLINFNIKVKEVEVFLDELILKFDERYVNEIQKIEKEINHDVKAIEYFLRQKIIEEFSEYELAEYVHFGCTSDDINNVAYAIMLKDVKENVFLKHWKKIIKNLKYKAEKYKDVTMLSRTHGQPATPSTVGKEFCVFFKRMKKKFFKLQQIKIFSKFNGSTGNYNAHYFSYPKINWKKISKEFIEEFQLDCNIYTTQIEPHDYISELFHCIIEFNLILLDLNRDLWMYMSFNYFSQKVSSMEVGSSVMPHKVNPIFFENSEGNIGLSNALLSFIAEKLPVSRLQRDLSDSTVLRNLGVAIAYSVLSYSTFLNGFSKININEECIRKDLNNNWVILSEAIQMTMRRYGIKQSYEKLKLFTMGKKVSKDILHRFINSLDLPKKVKSRLKKLTPSNYIGLSKKLVEDM